MRSVTLNGFKGVNKGVDLKCELNRDRTEWSKMTRLWSFLFDLNYRRQEGKERERARIRYLPVRQSKSDSKMG